MATQLNEITSTGVGFEACVGPGGGTGVLLAVE
jgi:hypothetical protein